MKDKIKFLSTRGLKIVVGFIIFWTLLGGIRLEIADRRGSRRDTISLHVYKVPRGWRQPEKKSWHDLFDKAKDKVFREVESKLDE